MRQTAAKLQQDIIGANLKCTCLELYKDVCRERICADDMIISWNSTKENIQQAALVDLLI